MTGLQPAARLRTKLLVPKRITLVTRMQTVGCVVTDRRLCKGIDFACLIKIDVKSPGVPGNATDEMMQPFRAVSHQPGEWR